MKQYSSGKLTDRHIKDYLMPYANGTLAFKRMTPAQALEKYIEIQRNLVDDSGNAVEQGVRYMRNKQLHCCGLPLKAINAGRKPLVCEACGTICGN